jgi:hypothetical protein
MTFAFLSGRLCCKKYPAPGSAGLMEARQRESTHAPRSLRASCIARAEAGETSIFQEIYRDGPDLPESRDGVAWVLLPWGAPPAGVADLL